jgi:hypothetical protein
MNAIAILGREVMQPQGLNGLARDTLDQSGPEILEVGLYTESVQIRESNCL